MSGSPPMESSEAVFRTHGDQLRVVEAMLAQVREIMATDVVDDGVVYEPAETTSRSPLSGMELDGAVGELASA